MDAGPHHPVGSLSNVWIRVEYRCGGGGGVDSPAAAGYHAACRPPPDQEVESPPLLTVGLSVHRESLAAGVALQSVPAFPAGPPWPRRRRTTVIQAHLRRTTHAVNGPDPPPRGQDTVPDRDRPAGLARRRRSRPPSTRRTRPACSARSRSTAARWTSTNPFFQSLGTNGRSCASCHVAVRRLDDHARARSGSRFDAHATGLDPIFRTVDGSNSPRADVSTVRGPAAAYSMLLNKGVIRVGLPIPAGRRVRAGRRRRPLRLRQAPPSSRCSAGRCPRRTCGSSPR